ncbi:BPSL0067 family protein [Oxalobacteraceae bacterium A2-2]
MSYIYSKVEELEDQPVVGSHQCVALVQRYAGAPVTTAWRQGGAVLGNAILKRGTAIATFVEGRYPNRSHGNHAALFVRAVGNGIWIMDQWKNKNKTRISLRLITSRGKDKQGRYIRPSENADAYSVIE